MSSYAAQINPADRWAIAAYVKALQLSQRVSIDRLGSTDLEQLQADVATVDDQQEVHEE